MALYNIYLENDAPGVEIRDPEKRRETWNEEKVKVDFTPTEGIVLVKMVDEFVKEVVDAKFKSTKGLPKEAIGLAFTLNKKVLTEILEQDYCEGVRIILASSNDLNGNLKTNVIVKPVSANLIELDELETISPTTKIKFSMSATECPPKNICTRGVVDSFFKSLEASLQ